MIFDTINPMNTATINRFSLLFAYGLPPFIIVFAAGLALTPLVAQYPELAIGITYDLTLTAPLLYLFLTRKTQLPKITAIPIFVVGVFLASTLLPKDQQFHLNFIKTWFLPIVEIGIVGVIGFFGLQIN